MQTQAPLPDESPNAAPHSSASIGELVADWLSTTGDRIGAVTRLAMAEARLAAISAALMAFLAVLAALFVFAAWGLGVAGVVHAFIDMGAALWAVLLSIAVVHVLGAIALWATAMRLGRYVEFRATQRQLFDDAGEVS